MAANIWLGGSEFIKDRFPAVGKYQLQITNTRIEGAGRSGLEFGDHAMLTKAIHDKSKYEINLNGNTIVNNGEAEIMIFAPQVHINARGNCWGRPEGLDEKSVLVLLPAKRKQLDATAPVACSEFKAKVDNKNITP